MNVVITLPKHLIKAIIMGEKFFEIRSSVPLHFDEKKDVIFVVQKGSKLVPLYFTIIRFCGFRNSSSKKRSNTLYFDECKFLAEKAAVSVEYINNYSKNKEKIYAWVIGCACKVYCPADLYSDLKIDKNPQSFIYRDYEWRKVEFKSWVWLHKPRYSAIFLIPSLEYKRYLRSLSSAKPSTL